MITGKPDLLLNLPRLEREIQAFRREVSAGNQWYIREKYVDRGPLDPFYILQFTNRVEERGDDLMGEPLYASRSAALTVKRLTRLPEGTDRSYWRAIARDDLIGRLDRFMTMYREDFLQPPGFRGDLHNPNQQHQRFREKRFLYRVCSPNKEIIGVGSQKFANMEDFSAIRGIVRDDNGIPLAEATVELVTNTATFQRVTGEEGEFWFSRISPGRYTLRVSGRDAHIAISKENFGNVQGTLFVGNRTILPGESISLLAPDEETFETVSNNTGKYGMPKLISGTYKVKVRGREIAAASG